MLSLDKTKNTDDLVKFIKANPCLSTACQLVAVAFQCQSQVQFGGVGSIHLDYDLAPFVKKSFFKHYADGLRYLKHKTKENADMFVRQCLELQESMNSNFAMLRLN